MKNLVVVSNLSHFFHTQNNKSFPISILKNVNLTFPSSGLISIVGKSGSGKSTLLNFIGLIDKPAEGEILYKGKSLNTFKEKEINKYRNLDIGIVFQHYNLLEDHTVLYNVMLPSLLAGEKEKNAKKQAIELLKKIKFPEKLINSKCFNLSGGEKQRVAILRSLINNPKIILADEPTGALDSKNSFEIMEIFKKISKNHLVIMVSHNQDLCEKFSDRIIELKDGSVVNDKVVIEKDEGINGSSEYLGKKRSSWIKTISTNNFKRRKKRNIVSICALSFGIFATCLISGFAIGSKESIKEKTLKQFDYGSATLSKEISTSIQQSSMSIVQMLRPTDTEIDTLKSELKDFYIDLNFDFIVPQIIDFKYKDSVLKDINYRPIYSFLDTSISNNLLIAGYIPHNDTINQVVINKTAYDFISEKIGDSPLNKTFEFSLFQTTYYYPDDISNPIIDTFSLNENIKVVGVVDELNFLNSPTFYYSYTGIKDILQNTILENLSSYFEYDISWYDRIYESKENEALSSYSYRLFLNDFNKVDYLPKLVEKVNAPFKISSLDLDVSNALTSLIDTCAMGMEIFLVIAVIGSILLLGIISFSSYTEDKKNSAVISSLGASKEQITNIYLYENLIISLFSFIIAIVLSLPFELLINYIVLKFTGFANIIAVPFLSFLGFPLLFPLILIISILIISLLSTIVPILFGKKISLRQELMDE